MHQIGDDRNSVQIERSGDSYGIRIVKDGNKFAAFFWMDPASVRRIAEAKLTYGEDFGSVMPVDMYISSLSYPCDIPIQSRGDLDGTLRLELESKRAGDKVHIVIILYAKRDTRSEGSSVLVKWDPLFVFGIDGDPNQLLNLLEPIRVPFPTNG